MGRWFLALVFALTAFPARTQAPPEMHPYFWQPLAVCFFKTQIVDEMAKLKQKARATFRDTKTGKVLVIYTNVEDRTWFLVVNYIDHPHGCIVQRGDKYRIQFGRPI